MWLLIYVKDEVKLVLASKVLSLKVLAAFA